MNRLRLSVYGLTAAAVWALPAMAALPNDDPFAEMAALADNDLGGYRGGMMIGGIPVNFAVVIRTTVEGALQQAGLQTALTINDQGKVGAAATTAIGAGGTSSAVAGGMAMAAPAPANVGSTTIWQQVVQDQVQTLIANSQSNVTLNHHTQIDMDMPGFNALHQTYATQVQASRMGYDAAQMGRR